MTPGSPETVAKGCELTKGAALSEKEARRRLAPRTCRNCGMSFSGDRCKPCVKARMAVRKAKSALGEPCDPPSRGKYVKGCRCAGCILASNDYARRFHASKSDQARHEINLRSRLKRKTALKAIKLASGCVDCGYKAHYVALQFDHLQGKSFNISTNLNRAWAVVLEETKKCEVVCANCHMIRTWARANRYELVDAKGNVVMSVLNGVSVKTIDLPLSRTRG